MGKKPSTTHKWRFFISVAGFIFINMSWLIGTWPGTFVQDAAETWQQMLSGQYKDWHPLANIFYMKILSIDGRFPFLISIFQQTIFLALILNILRLISPNMAIEKRIMVATLMAATPFFGPMLVTPVKDIPYSLFTLLGVCNLISSRESKTYLLKGLSLILVGALFRHESVFTILIFSFLLLSAKVVFQKYFKSGIKLIPLTIPLALIFVVFTALSIDKSIHSSIEVEPSPNWWKYSPLLADIAYVLNSDPNFAKSKIGNESSKFFGGEYPLGADRCSNPGLLLSSSLNNDYAEMNAKKIPGVWLKIFVSGNRQIIESHICRAIPFIPPPLTKFPDYETSWKFTLWTSYGSWNGYEAFIGSKNQITKFIFNILDTWRQSWNFLGRFIAWPGLHLTFIIGASYYSLKRRFCPTFPIFMLSTFCISRMMTLILYTGGPDYRYAFLVHIVSASLLTSLICNQRDRSRMDNTIE